MLWLPVQLCAGLGGVSSTVEAQELAREIAEKVPALFKADTLGAEALLDSY